MTKIYVQNQKEIWASTASLAANASSSGSIICNGYSRIVGGVWSSASGKAASGLVIQQSLDYGANWDIVTACVAVSEGLAASLSGASILGNAVRVTYRNGADGASLFRAYFAVRPIE